MAHAILKFWFIFSIIWGKILTIRAKYIFKLFFWSFTFLVFPWISNYPYTFVTMSTMPHILFCISLFPQSFTLKIFYWPIFLFTNYLLFYVWHDVKPIGLSLNVSYYIFLEFSPDRFYRVQYADKIIHHFIHFFETINHNYIIVLSVMPVAWLCVCLFLLSLFNLLGLAICPCLQHASFFFLIRCPILCIINYSF